MKLASVHVKNKHSEPAWHVQLALLLVIGFQIALSSDLTVGPKYILAGCGLGLMVLLAIIRPSDKPATKKFRRTIALVLIVLISLMNLTSLGLVIDGLFHFGTITGKDLILSAAAIYLTNIIIFGLWYWELDSDGVQGQSVDIEPVDFLFPQSTVPHLTSSKNWVPTFFDYLYISVTNATAFSPNDTVPLSHRAKVLMMTQSLISLVTVALVVTRAVSILA